MQSLLWFIVIAISRSESKSPEISFQYVLFDGVKVNFYGVLLKLYKDGNAELICKGDIILNDYLDLHICFRNNFGQPQVRK